LAVKHHILMFDVQLLTFAPNFALASAGRSSAARMAMMAITTSSSINVNACFRE
jgi:hypothetical protein